jgi:hypothetical protein
MLQHGLTASGKPDTAVTALEQRETQLVLEPPYVTADRRGADAERVRRTGEIPRRRGRYEIFEITQLH